MKKLNILAAGAALTFAAVGAAQAQTSPTLEATKQRGQVNCIVSEATAGFSSPDDKGVWRGIDVDMCRAVSSAIFGSPDKVKFIPTTSKVRFTALQSGEGDILSRNTTWTLVRDVNLGFEFTGVTFYDGQGFMVRKSLGVKSAKELDGAAVCVSTGTTTELNLADYFRANNMKYNGVVIEGADAIIKAYESGRCDVYTTDKSGLAGDRTKLSAPDEHMILPETISKEPLGPSVRHGDQAWGDIVRWVQYAMIEAEEYGVTSANVDDLKANSTNPVHRRLLGVEGDLGAMLGLSNDWAYNVIKQVGNYGESYERNVGPSTRVNIPREGSPNALWTKGGLIYAMPVR